MKYSYALWVQPVRAQPKFSNPNATAMTSDLRGRQAMTISIVSSKYLPSIGGLQTAVRNIAQQFQKEGHYIHIITNRYSRHLPRTDIIDGVFVRRLFFTDRPPETRNLWIWCKYGVRLLIGPLTLWVLVCELRRIRPDIVHLHYVGSPSLYLIVAKRILRFRLVVSIHGSDVDLPPVGYMYQRWLLKHTLNAADFFTSNSKDLLEQVLDFVGKNHISKSCVVPMAFSPQVYDDIVEPYFHRRPYLFAAGRLTHVKGFDVLIRAFARIIKEKRYDGDLIIAGNGEELNRYRQLTRMSKITEKVHFVGFVNERKMASLMKGCELFVVPSRKEAFGIVVLEALYGGKRVVATAAKGIIGLMEQNLDKLVNPDDPIALADKIVETLKDGHWHPVDRDSIRRKYNWRTVVDSYVSIFEKVLGTDEVAVAEQGQFGNI